MPNSRRLFTILHSGLPGADVAPDQSVRTIVRGDTGMHAIRFLTRCFTIAIAVVVVVTSVLMVRYHFNESPLLGRSRQALEQSQRGTHCPFARPAASELEGRRRAGSIPVRSRSPSCAARSFLLDFWTFCCINCHHILPDLAKLEEKYKDELVVIGVHSAKFEAERDTENIRRKVAEYRIKHPVVNDANMTIWKHFGVTSWPTLVLIDPDGHYRRPSERRGDTSRSSTALSASSSKHKAKGDLNLTPLKFTPEMESLTTAPCSIPGKVLADRPGKRLFIADTGHNRIVQTDLDGKITSHDRQRRGGL